MCYSSISILANMASDKRKELRHTSIKDEGEGRQSIPASEYHPPTTSLQPQFRPRLQPLIIKKLIIISNTKNIFPVQMLSGKIADVTETQFSIRIIRKTLFRQPFSNFYTCECTTPNHNAGGHITVCSSH